MKRHEKRVRRQNSAATVPTQPQNQASPQTPGQTAKAKTEGESFKQWTAHVLGTLNGILAREDGLPEQLQVLHLKNLVAGLIQAGEREIKTAQAAMSEVVGIVARRSSVKLTRGQEFVELEASCNEAADLLNLLSERLEPHLSDCGSPGEGEGMRSLSNRMGKELVVCFQGAECLYKEARQKAGAK
jgi:hypothetical protein